MLDKGDRYQKKPFPFDFNRRQFIKRVGFIGAGAAGAMIGEQLLASRSQNAQAAEKEFIAANPTSTGEIPRRPLGKTGIEVSALGLGGHAIGQAGSYEAAERIVHEAIAAGITFMDNAWEYNNHRSEEWMGRALKGRRDDVFLMTKVCTHGRDAKVAMAQLEESLRRLQTDYLDLWQIHEVIYYNDPELVFRPDGAIEALERAKEQGKVRFVGFTGHKDPAIHLQMLSYDYPFDTVQLPLNCFDATFDSFESKVLPELNSRGIAALGMKSLSGNGEAIKNGLLTPQEALSYVMSLPVATTVSGIDSLEVLRQNVAVAQNFTPLNPEQMQALRDRCAPYAADGRYELFKTSKRFDGPTGREMHGFPTRS